MPKKRDVSPRVTDVALMALSKRQFFQSLLHDVRGTLEEARSELGLEEDDITAVEELVAAYLESRSHEDVLTFWDDWRSTGRWGGDRGWITVGWITTDET